MTVTASQALRVDFVLRQANAHLIGQVVDNLGVPVGNIGFNASDRQNANNSMITDGNGNFNIGVSGGTWYLQLSTEDAQQRQLIGPELQITLTNGETRSNIVVVVQHATAQINGYVMDTSTNPIANVGVYSSVTLNGTNYSDYIRTDGSGNYQLRACNGTWQVGLACDGLQARGYGCVNSVQASVAGANVTLNFTVEPLQPLLTALHRNGNQFQLQLTGATGQTYTVQYSTDLAGGNWLSLLTTNPTAATVTILDLTATNSARFYRAVVGP